MSEAIGASVGSVGAVATVGSSVAAGASMSGEFTASGIGFDGGSPSFSGLGRSDANLGAFSVNEGSKGPVSFSNSTDLFSETRSFTSSLGSVPEGPVKGETFSSEMQTLALGSDIGISNPTTEKPSMFGELEPFQATMQVNEGPAPMPSLEGFTTIASFSEPLVGFESEAEQDSQVSIEAVVDSETIEMGLEKPDIKGAVEDLRTNDPLTYMQLKSDLESVQTILNIVDEVTDSQTAANISNIAISTAVERSGLIQALEKVSEEPEAETEPSTDPVNANVHAIMEAINPPVEEVVQPKQEQPKAEYYVDEEANDARRTETAKAIKTAFEVDADPITGEVSGNAVVDRLAPEPPTEEISEIVLKEGGKSDGSEAQRRNGLKLLKLSTIEAGLNASDRLIEENRAVTDEEAAKRATQAEAEKVKSGLKTQIGEIEVFPLAA